LNGSGSTVSLYSNGSELTIASGSCNPVAAIIGTPIDADQVSNLDDFAVMSEQPPAELGAYIEQMSWDGVHDLYPLNQFAPSDEEDGIAVFDAAYIVGKALVLEAEWKRVAVAHKYLCTTPITKGHSTPEVSLTSSLSNMGEHAIV
jgi:hypothetical protein